MSTASQQAGDQPLETALPPAVAARLDVLPLFAGRDLQAHLLDGGLTNTNYRVTLDGRSYVARLSDPATSLLAIDRVAEHANSVAAAASGVSPAVVGYVPAAGVLVVEWVAGRTLTDLDVRDDANLPRIARACRQLHAGPAFRGDFDMFDIQRRYLAVVLERGMWLPERYLEFMPAVDRIRAALAVRQVPSVPCNNDLLPANLIDDGERIWLIDYEYSWNNDPCFELGNIWSESGLELGQLDLLVTAYYGRRRPGRVARARLLGLMSKYGWTLWASIQDRVSTLEVDFRSWGLERYERAVAEFDGPDLARLIEEVQRDE